MIYHSRYDFRLSQHPDAIEHAETTAELQAADHEQDVYGWLADYAAAREYGGGR